MIDVVIAVVLVLLLLWAISARRRLAVMEENINNAMGQLGVQLSSRFDALTALLELTRGYDAQASRGLLEAVKSRRSAITATSTPAEVQRQEEVISEALGRVFLVAEQCPALKADGGYARAVNAVDSYGKMVGTSRLIYNDSVTKFNRELRMFPAALLGRLLGFRAKDYLEAAEDAAPGPV